MMSIKIKTRRKVMKQIGLVLLCMGTLYTASFAESTPAISRPEGQSGIQMDDSGSTPYIPAGGGQSPQYQYETPRFQYRPIARKPTTNQTVKPNPLIHTKQSALTFGQMADSIKKSNGSSPGFTFKLLADKLKEKKPTENSLNTEKIPVKRLSDQE